MINDNFFLKVLSEYQSLNELGFTLREIQSSDTLNLTEISSNL